MNKIGVLVVNINNLNYTKDCINDLLKQTYKNFNITLVDQGSIEEGTKEYLNSLFDNDKIKIIRNDHNVSLNKLWNNFYYNSEEEYLCYLNNDVRLTDNFIQDTLNIFRKEEKTGIVIHSTNSFNYNKKLDDLNYIIYDKKIKQGWDFTIRKSIYNPIPTELLFYFGDDWLFHHCYEKGYNVAICLSSPIIHYAEKSSKYSPVSFRQDEVFFNKLGLKRYLPHYNDYNEILPTFKYFDDNSIETIIYLGLNCSILNYNNIYFDNDRITELNNKIIDQLKNNNEVDRYTKDVIKINISHIINDAINGGYDKLCIYNVNLIYTLDYFLKHLPNVKIITEIAINNNDIIDDISKKNQLDKEKCIKYIQNYNEDVINLIKKYK